MPAIVQTIQEPPAITILGSRIEDSTVTATTTIEHEQVETFEDISLLDVLDATPGVRAISVGGVAGGSFLSIRGGEPNFTLVTVEGIKLNDPTNSRGGAFDLSLIDSDLVESLTVIRGPGSAIQGSDALSGMIDIRFAAPLREAFSLSGRGVVSTRGEAGGTASTSAGWKSGGFLAAAGAYESGSLDEGSDLKRRQGLVKLRQRAGTFEMKIFGLHAWASRDVFPEDSGGPLLAVNREREHGTTLLNAASLSIARDRSARLRPNLLLSFSRQEDDSHSPFIAPGELEGVPASENHSRFDRVEAVGSLAFDARIMSLSVGGAALREVGRSSGSLDFGLPFPTNFRLDRTTRSAFAEGSLRPASGLLINVAGRADKIAGAGTSTTGRIAARWQVTPSGPVVFASAGEGYKQPSFFALGHPLIGNPDLKPEQSTNAEIGASVRFKKGEAQLTGFRQTFRNLVDFDAQSFRLVNRSRVTSSGAEFEFSWNPSRSLELAGSATYLHIDSSTRLRNRPHVSTAGRIRWSPLPRIAVSAQLKENSRFFDSSIPTGPLVTKGHVEADLAVRFDIGKMSADLALGNLFDSHAEDAVGFPEAGRLLRISVRARY